LAKPPEPDFSGPFHNLSRLVLTAAQDFNDELTFILNCADDSLELLGGEHAARENLLEVKLRAIRCGDMMQSLLRLTSRTAVPYGRVEPGDAHPGNRNVV
jgi:hypothetical protein